jgi:hypothetical protein
MVLKSSPAFFPFEKRKRKTISSFLLSLLVIAEAFKAVEESGCDFLTRTRVETGGEIPGALWHIYQARDADRIRDFLNKVFFSKGKKLNLNYGSFLFNFRCFVCRRLLWNEENGSSLITILFTTRAGTSTENLENDCIKNTEWLATLFFSVWATLFSSPRERLIRYECREIKFVIVQNINSYVDYF